MSGDTTSLHYTDNDKAFYDRFSLPYPTMSITEREQRRLTFRNERAIYSASCDKCDASIISMYGSGKPFPVYCRDCYLGDDWNPLSYGRDIDFTRPFFDQFFELRAVVPKQNNGSLNNVNSSYTNFTADSKSCFMVIATENCEECMYGKLCQTSISCLDCDYIWDSELCYQCINVSSCYHCAGCALTEASHDCWFSFDMKGCASCCFCHNLRNKQFHIFNKEYSEEEYHEKLKEFGFNTDSGFQKGFLTLQELVKNSAIHKMSDLISCENSIGDHLKNCKNMYMCYDMQDSEECAYGAEGDAMHSIDFNNVYYKPEWCNELLSALQTTQVFYSMFCYYTQDAYYSDYCLNSHNLFGCVGLKHNEYCILNKQYSKEEYEQLKNKLIEHMKQTGEWGQFFPAAKSPFGYNETVAHEYYPLTEEEAIAQGFTWRKPDKKDYQKQEYEVPDAIEEVKDDVVGQILACIETGKNFKIQQQELAFYRQNNFPIPRTCPDQRHTNRMLFRNPREVWLRACSKCGGQQYSTINPSGPEKAYCEQCYNAEIY